MGYYTEHTLTVCHEDMSLVEDVKTYKEISEVLAGFIGKIDAEYLMEGGSFEAKWYHHQEEMKKLAAQFPNIIFELEGQGENQSDWWREFYHGQNFYRTEAKLIPPEDKPPQEFFES